MEHREWLRQRFDERIALLVTLTDGWWAESCLDAYAEGMLRSTLRPLAETTPAERRVAEALDVLDELAAARTRLRAARDARRDAKPFDLSGVKAIAERGELPR